MSDKDKNKYRYKSFSQLWLDYPTERIKLIWFAGLIFLLYVTIKGQAYIPSWINIYYILVPWAVLGPIALYIKEKHLKSK